MTEQQGEIISSIRNKILSDLEFKGDVTDDQIQEMIAEEISNYGKKEFIAVKDKVYLGKQIYHALRKLDILQELVDDPTITEIMINGSSSIFIEKNGKRSVIC